MIFITFEGIEGSGKTTIIKSLLLFLIKANKKVFSIQEPSIFKEEKINFKKLLLSDANKKLLPLTETLLFFASQYQNNQNYIKYFLNKKDEIYVISDRYFDSTIVYQGYVKKLNLKLILNLIKEINLFQPDFTFFLDLDVNKALERKNNQKAKKNYLDKYPLQFHQKIREAYLDWQKKNSRRIKIIDCNKKSLIVIRNEILKILNIKIN
jgi:dTMP kinase